MSVLLGETRTFTQGNGPDIQLRVFGDEFYARFETVNGYTAVYDAGRRQYCYAILEAGHLVSSGAPTSKPVAPGLVRHLQEDKDIRNEKFSRRYDEMRPKASHPPGVSATFGESNGLLMGTVLSDQAKVKGLTIIVNFLDVKTTITKEQVEGLLNGDNFTAHGNYCSVKEYFQLMSNNSLEYTNRVVGPIELPRNRTHYIENALMKEALDMAVREYDIDMAEFDSKGRRVADAVNFVYAGETVYAGGLWPHNWTMDNRGGASYGGIQVDLYTIQSLGRAPVDMKIGTFCHEAGHLICRFPDLYDYGTRDGDSDPSAGMGKYCLMSSGNQLDHGRTPSPLSAYLRELAGWTEEVILTPGQYELKHGEYHRVYKYKTTRSNEYFLVENRSRMGLDGYIKSSGLAVYHCDTRGSNEWQGGTSTKHYQCALLQADGARHLENNRNGGDDGDMFKEKAGLCLSHGTIPSSKAWGGSESGLNLLNLSTPGEVIRFQISDSTEDPDVGVDEGDTTTTLTMVSRPSRLIPDNDPAGVTDTISIAKMGKLAEIKIDVDISHSYIGDLKIVLLAPDGQTFLLWNKEGGSEDDLRVSYDSTSSDSLLSKLKGVAITGDWQLNVCDLAGADTGKLRSWTMTVSYQATGGHFSGQAVADMQIPDNDPTGVASTISVPDSGMMKKGKVLLEIDHSYHGDLEVILVAPSGRQSNVITRNSLGAAGGKLTKSVLLDTFFANEDIRGDWQLLVRDTWGVDTGTLERWSLELDY